MKTLKLLALLFVSSLTIVSCSNNDDDDHNDGNEEELITTVMYTLTNNANGADVVTLTFTDLDGEGGADGVYNISGPLTANATYTGAIEFLNETENPAEDITEEVEEEGDEHEIFYSNTVGLTITKNDTDGDGNPLGLETTLTTGAASNGTITVILRHEPTKPNDGTAAGAGGSTDAQVSYSVVVQ
ncbi:type 1 periplasmic binding fold superfamily protein [Flavobacteriaceae sp. LMIT009]